MAIFDEQVLEPFVAKGIGNSGVASRQIQASNLPDLSAAVRQSQMTQQNLSDQQISLAKSLSMKNISKGMTSRGSGNGSDGGSGAFVIGKIKAGGNGTTPERVTVAVPDGKGSFTLRTFMTGEAGLAGNANIGAIENDKAVMKELGINYNNMQDYPEIGISGLSGTYKKNELMDTLLTYSKGKTNSGVGISLSDIIKKIG